MRLNLVNIFNSIFNRHAPLRPVSREDNRLSDKPWITRGILASIKTKNKLFKKYFENKNIDTDKSKKEHYKKYLNKLTHVKNLAKRIYYENSIKCNNNNPSQTWSIIKEIIDHKNSAKKNCITFCNYYRRWKCENWHVKICKKFMRIFCQHWSKNVSKTSVLWCILL